MRIGIALIILADLLIRGADLTAHYSDNGLWPTRLLYNFGWKPGYWSIHALSGNYSFELIIFIMHFIFALFLLIGYKTKWSTFLVWLLTISLHNRNLFVQQGGDDLLRLLLFWGIFLPWNASYALDCEQKTTLRKQNTLANIGYLLLLASVYFFTVNLKTGSEWRSDGTAIYYALSLDQLRLPLFGDYLHQFPSWMRFFTHFVFYIELILPLLILWPAKKGYLRLTAFVLIILLHLGIGLTLYVGLFFVINMVAGIGLLPSFIMDKIETLFQFKKKLNGIYIIHKSRLLNFLSNSIMILVICLSLIINLSSLDWFKYQLRKEIWYPVNVFRLDQYWGMFSPCILKKDGWFVYHGVDSLGRQWDLRLNQDYVDYTKPKHVVSMYKSDRWRKLAENMQNTQFTFLRPQYGRYILRIWNLQHPEKKIATLNLYFMEKENLLNYKTSVLNKNLYCVCIENE